MLEVSDKSLLFQDLRDALLELRRRHVDVVVSCRRGIADAREHICDGIRNLHDFSLPARLDHARELAAQGKLPETDAAKPEFSQVGPRTPADMAAVPVLYRIPGLSLTLDDLRYLSHSTPALTSARSEGHAQQLEQATPLFVGFGVGDDRHLHPADPIDLVVLDLGKHDLFA